MNRSDTTTGFERGVEILHRDECLFAVSKPSGLSVHRGWDDDNDVLVGRVRKILGTRKVFPLHRLDRATSGVVLFALDADVAREMSARFVEHRIEKCYLALVRGVTDESGRIDKPLRKQPKSEEFVEACTEFRRLLALPTLPRETSLLEVRPLSGKLHQIRRHLKSLSHPLIGDANYGKGPINRDMRDRYGLSRLALHAWGLCVLHPRTGQELRIVAPVPDDFAHPLRRMGYPGEQLEAPDWAARSFGNAALQIHADS